MKKIIILGATGFIGRNLCEYFSKKNYSVYGTYNKKKFFKNKRIKFLKCNLLNKKQVDNCLKNKDIVIMAAATTSGAKDIIERPYIHVTDNSIMNSIITRSAFDKKIPHVIFFSCTIMYHSQNRKIKEKDFNLNKKINPNYFGGAWMKIFSEKICEFYSKFKVNKYTVIRHSNIYGPHDKFDLQKSHVFGATMTKVLNSNNNEITIWGKGNEKRDLLYIEDLCNFVELAIRKQKKSYEIFNVGSGKLISVKNLAKKIAFQAKKKIKFNFDLTKKTIRSKVSLNCTKANKILGWEVKNRLDSGINKTIQWYKKNII
jgi:GDP-L-fucose synthase